MLTHEQLQAIFGKAAGGDAWYGFSTARLLDGLSGAQAAARPLDGSHSIWELVLHMTAWASEVERRLGGSAPQLPSEGDWAEVDDTSDAAWDAVVDRFFIANQRLSSRIGEFADIKWAEVVGGARSPELGTGVTFAEMVLGILQHNAYHAGQIALLRKLVTASARNDT